MLRGPWFVLPLCACVTSAGTEPCDATGYTPHEPLALPGDGDTGDPHVIESDGRWYLYPSYSRRREQEGFHVWTSDDLSSWSGPGRVWAPIPGTWHDGGENGRTRDCTYWAPSVHERDDGFYLYYTANCRIGVAFSTSPLGPFEELLDHPLVGSGYGGIGDGVLGETLDDYDELAIDPFLLDDPEHGLWLYFVAYSPLSNLYAMPMSDPATPAGAPELVLEPDTGSWEGLVAEGVWLERVDDALHLMYSGNFVHTEAYAIGIARGTDPRGPFERQSPQPMLASELEMGLWGPGHHSVARDAAGARVLFYHTTVDPEADDPRRRVRAAPLCVDDRGELFVPKP